MTVDNFNYRTNPMFLRNEFTGTGKWEMPVIPKFEMTQEDADDLRLIGFDKVKTGKDVHFNRMVHFFLYDYKFEDIWTKPEKYTEILRRYRGVLTPDFSMYTEMNPVMQLYNTFRNRWTGAYYAEKGLRVVPTVNWGLENTFDFCFNGIEKGSAVAVSTYMVSEHDGHKDQKAFFLKGYEEMLRRIEPEVIICYHYPFPEMRGNILFVDYDLSAWQHYGDDIDKSCLYTQTEQYILGYKPIPEGSHLITKTCPGCIADTVKGTGSAYGGEWKPKKPEAERFLGEPNTINRHIKSNGEVYETKIGPDGRAVSERHYTTHDREHTGHTNPHDHLIDWDTGHPHVGKPINYPDGNIPEFKPYMEVKTMAEYYQNIEEEQFESIDDFKWCMECGGEVQFDWHGKSYGIGHDPGDIIAVYEANNAASEVYFKSADEVLDMQFDGEPLRNIITQIFVTERTI